MAQKGDGIFFFEGYYKSIMTIRTEAGRWRMFKAIYEYETRRILPDEKTAKSGIFLLIKAMIDGREGKKMSIGNRENEESQIEQETTGEECVENSCGNFKAGVESVDEKMDEVKPDIIYNKNINKNINKNKKKNTSPSTSPSPGGRGRKEEEEEKVSSERGSGVGARGTPERGRKDEEESCFSERGSGAGARGTPGRGRKDEEEESYFSERGSGAGARGTPERGRKEEEEERILSERGSGAGAWGTPGRGRKEEEESGLKSFKIMDDVPDIEKVKEFCSLCKLDVSPEAFKAYYDQKGWAVKGTRVYDWRSLILEWQAREQRKTKGAKKVPERRYTDEENDKLFDNLDDIKI